jgi:LPS sulfotransferase NodH
MRSARAAEDGGLPSDKDLGRAFEHTEFGLDFGIIPQGGHEQNLVDFFENCELTHVEGLAAIDHFTLVCFTNRCGSTYVCSALSQLGLAGEPDDFNYEYLNFDKTIRISKEHGFRRFSDYLSYCVKTYSANGSLLVKASVDQLNFLIKAGCFRSLPKRPKLILVTRRNVIAQAISYCVALQDGQWTSLHQAPPKGFIPKYDAAQILTVAREIMMQNAWFELLFSFHQIDALGLIYEDVAADGGALLETLHKAYGLDGSIMVQPTRLPVKRQDTPLKRVWEGKIRSLGAEMWKDLSSVSTKRKG